MNNTTDMKSTVEAIRSHAPDFTAHTGIILGSGLASLADAITDPISIAYSDLPGFKKPSVSGHPGQLVLGQLNGLSVACLQGRPHFYEGCDNTEIKTPIYALKALGCQNLIITNAAASLRAEVQPGSLVTITDHINMQFNSPLTGPNEDEFGPRFPAMTNAYDPHLRKQLHEIARKQGVKMHEGIYVGVLGPAYETPAEIRAFRLLGGDVVGMSTVPEVITARHCDLKVLTISTITNMASGMADETLNHENVLVVAQQVATKLTQLIMSFCEHTANQVRVAA